jgi:hypothetical protein
MTKLISGRVHKVPSANVSADRYEFIELSETEPDLGLPSQLGQVFTSDLAGYRRWTRLDTANVTESPSNLYFTNDRVTANVANLSIGTLFNVKLGANLTTGKALVYDSNVNAFVPVFVNSEVANIADLAGKVLSLENQTTANVREASSNLYYTNTRVFDAIAFVDTLNTKNLNVNGNLTIANTIFLTTGAFVGNIRLTESLSSNTLFANNAVIGSGVGGSITGANLISAAYVQANAWLGLFTANVVETAGNLYYTNARARNALTGSTGVYYDAANGIIAIGQDVRTTDNVQFKDLTISGNLYILGNIAAIYSNTLVVNDSMIQLGYGNPADLFDLGFIGHYVSGGERHAGFFRDHVDGTFKVFDNLTAEPGLNDLDTANVSFRLANIRATTFFGNVIGTVSSIANHNTDALQEGNVNLYYTNARTVQTVTPLLTTGNVVETTNQYFTNARVVQAVTPVLTTANVVELTNLYFTNARVLANVEQMSMNVFADVDMSGIGLNGILVWDGTKFVPGSTTSAESANFANVSLLSNIANSVLSISNFTTANLLEASGNLYFTNARAISAFTAGRGIIIQENGVIKSTIGSDLFSTSIDGTVGYTVNNTMSPAVTFPSTPITNRFILRSMQITNISNQMAFVSGNVSYASSNTALLANKIGIPVGASLEFIKRPQIFTPGDKINLQGFNASEVATNDLLSASFTYETIYDDITYSVAAQTLYASNNNITLLAPDQSYAIVESLKFINHHTDDVTITALWTDANSATKAYFAFNMPVPASSSMEVLQAPKKINNTDKLIVSYGNAANGLVSAFASYRLGAVTTPIGATTLADTGGTVSISLQTTITDGTTLYYTIS